MKKILKIAGLSVAGIFVLLIVIGTIVGPQPKKQEAVATTTPSATVQTKSSGSAATSQTVKPTGQAIAVQPSTQGTARCNIRNYLPDPNCTPGVIDTRVTQENIHSTICVSGYTATVRPSTSITSKIKTERMIAYGDTDSPSNYELDHFISLELGGSPDNVANLFPEPYAEPYGAYSKDKVENYLHKQVCNGAITLATAQQQIKTNWVSVYRDCCSTKTATPTQAPTSTSTQTSGHVFYLSTYATSKYYYCDTDIAWKSLSPSYLKSYPSEQDLLKAYPTRVLHEACK